MLSGLNLSGPVGALLGLTVIALFVFRQFSTRRVASRWAVGLPLVLAYFGLQSVGQLDSIGWLLLGINVSLGVALGFARAATLRIWTGEQGEALMRGTALTLVLWLATIAVRAVMSIAEVKLGFGATVATGAESLLPAAVTIGAQSLVAYLRAQDQRFATA